MRDSALESSVYKLSKYERFKSVFNHIIKFISNFLFMFFVVIILVILVYGLYTKKNGNNGYVPIVSAYVIVSPSMVPTINVYDAVVSYRPNVDTLKKGDIITFNSTDARYAGRTVTHRILGVTDIDGQVAFRTKGDNNTTLDDAYVLGGNIYGKVFFVIPWLGYLQILLTKPYGWILLVVLPCTFIIVSDIIKLSRTIKKGKSATGHNFKNVEIVDDPTPVRDDNVQSEIVEETVKFQKENIDIPIENVSYLNSNSIDEEKNIVPTLEKQVDLNITNELQNIDLIEKGTPLISLNRSERKNIVVVSHYKRITITDLNDFSLEKDSYSASSFNIVIASHYSRNKKLDIFGMTKYEEKAEDQDREKEEEKEIDSYIEIL